MYRNLDAVLYKCIEMFHRLEQGFSGLAPAGYRQSHNPLMLFDLQTPADTKHHEILPPLMWCIVKLPVMAPPKNIQKALWCCQLFPKDHEE